MKRDEKNLTTQAVVVWMERAIDGTAASAHLKGTLVRLQAIDGVAVVRLIGDTKTKDGHETYSRKLRRIASITLRGALAARRNRVLIARYHPLMLPMVLIWRMVGGTVVLSVQGALDSASDNEYPWLKGSQLLRRVSVWTAKLAHGLIAGAPTIEDHVRTEMLGKRALLFPIANGVFISEFATARTKERPQAEPYAVFVGNLAKWQGIDTLVAAVLDPSWPKGLPLVIVGDGADRELVEEAPGVIWVGRQPSAEAQRWLSHATCAFSLQRSDVSVAAYGFWPFKLIESAAAGVPMICSDAPGLRQAAEKLGHALVVPAHDAAATAEATLKIWSNPQLQAKLRESGQKNAVEFDWAAGAPALADLIRRVHSRKPTGRSGN